MHAGHIKRDRPIDVMLGRRIRALRLTKGVSQSALAKRLGVTVQQVQRYERGATRIGVGRLIEIAAALRLPLNTFLFLQPVERAPRHACQDNPVAPLSHDQAVRLAKAFATLPPGGARARQCRPRRTPM